MSDRQRLSHLSEALERQGRIWRERGEYWAGRKFESAYFECHAYKKRTLHLFFKDRELWERFNLEAARGKNWLPDDVKARAAARETHSAGSLLALEA